MTAGDRKITTAKKLVPKPERAPAKKGKKVSKGQMMLASVGTIPQKNANAETDQAQKADDAEASSLDSFRSSPFSESFQSKGFQYLSDTQVGPTKDLPLGPSTNRFLEIELSTNRFLEIELTVTQRPKNPEPQFLHPPPVNLTA
ncbi:hypothetical protein A6R68_00808 [Neotoma lepida]|uniref:Uncharacterized protein n=1 Tax=Neotoma lepida TaxID=56216 RepID=A0A1A6GZ67_NEOLE|nr:hypothetical protein A6R68_00808 [Neotoma lepida]